MPSTGASGRARKIATWRLVEVQVYEGHAEGAEEDQDRDPEQRPAEDDVLVGDIRRRLDRLARRARRQRLAHPTTGSSAIATNSSARDRSEKWKSTAARRGVVSRRSRSASQRKTAPSARAATRETTPSGPRTDRSD